ncbi:MAG: glycoside hydrolase family 97 N-terminal domain-containing protein [Bacteroidales bacterium]
MKHALLLAFLLMIVFLSIALDLNAQAVFSIQSPNSKIDLNIRLTDKIELEVLLDSIIVLNYSKIALEIDSIVLGETPKVLKKITNSMDDNIIPVVPEKFKNIRDRYNEMILLFKGKYRVNFRAYDNGIAWQWETTSKDEVVINNETVDFHFPEESHVWFPEEQSFFSHNERYYLYERLDGISNERFCSLPALIETAIGPKLLITESSLFDYPGMWLRGTGSNLLKAIFPGMALEEEQTNDRNVKVSKHADYIANTNGSRTFPWRIVAIAENDAELITNQLGYILGKPCAIGDPSWIKPGKVAWDWWNDWNIYGG